jgi:peptidoglycan hydrolase-like protein with peptidoglycan-binding domain
MSDAVFVVPTVLWHGAEPAAADFPENFGQLLWQLDRALLLLEVAGYQAGQVVIEVPVGSPAAVEPVSGEVGPPGHGWSVAADGSGQVGLWVGPRTGMGALDGPSTAQLALAPVDFGTLWPDATGLNLGFRPTRAGWLILPAVAGTSLYAQLQPAVEHLIEVLRSGIAAAYLKSRPGPDDVPGPGLLSMLDPDTWNVSSGSALPDPAAWTAYGPTLVQLGRSVRDLVLGAGGIGLDTFLAQETSVDPAPSTLVPDQADPDPGPIRRHSVLERLREAADAAGSTPSLVDVQPGQWLAGMYSALRPLAGAPVGVAELDLLTWTELLMILHSVGVVDFLSARPAPDTGDLYGRRDLHLGDTGPEVGELQRDLGALGFVMIDPAESTFGTTTDWAVREFQIYAKLPTTARWLRDTVPYADGLERVTVLPDQTYPGESTGLVDLDTRRAIARWQANLWRCPVVAEAWTMTGDQRVTVSKELDNVWGRDQAPAGKRVFVRDFTDNYVLPTSHPSTERHVVGRYVSFSSFGGPQALPANAHCWNEAEMRADITGSASPTGAALSMFRVVRMVAEVECYAFLDSITAYDRGVVSVGPCNWTLGLVPNEGTAGARRVDIGELAGFLAYVAERFPDSYHQAVGQFGLQPDVPWATTGQPYLRTLRKYSGWYRRMDSSGQLQPLPSSSADQAERVTDAYRSWHWVYRLQMAGRTIPRWRTANWEFVRIRLRDLLATPWGTTTDPGSAVADVRNTDGSTRPATIGDVYTSERSVALLLRWHVKSPAHLVDSSDTAPNVTYRAAEELRKAFAAAKKASSTIAGSPTGWHDTDEKLLITGIMDNLPSDDDLRKTMKQIQRWPEQEKDAAYPSYWQLDPASLGTIGETRHSYVSDYRDLPTAPDYALAKPG